MKCSKAHIGAVSALTSALVDCSRLFVQIVRVRLVQVEALCGVRHRRTMLRLVWERSARWQNWAGQVCLRAAMWVPLVRQLMKRTQTTDVPFKNWGFFSYGCLCILVTKAGGEKLKGGGFI